MIVAIALTIGIGLIWGTTSMVYATETPKDGISTIIERIAVKFGLKKQDVQAVVDQVQSERQATRQKDALDQLEARLSVAVKNGKITEAQKSLIIAKHNELQAQRVKDQSTWQNLTPAERKTKMDEQRTALEAWAKQNNIDSQYIYGFGGRGEGFGMGSGKGRGMSR